MPKIHLEVRVLFAAVDVKRNQMISSDIELIPNSDLLVKIVPLACCAGFKFHIPTFQIHLVALFKQLQ